MPADCTITSGPDSWVRPAAISATPSASLKTAAVSADDTFCAFAVVVCTLKATYTVSLVTCARRRRPAAGEDAAKIALLERAVMLTDDTGVPNVAATPVTNDCTCAGPKVATV